jgi:hypothetical protein
MDVNGNLGVLLFPYHVAQSDLSEPSFDVVLQSHISVHMGTRKAMLDHILCDISFFLNPHLFSNHSAHRNMATLVQIYIYHSTLLFLKSSDDPLCKLF